MGEAPSGFSSHPSMRNILAEVRHQRIFEPIVLIFTPDSSKRLSTFENITEIPFECRIRPSNDAKFRQTAMSSFLALF